MAGPSSLDSPSNFILGRDPLYTYEREGGHTPFRNHSVRFRWVIQVVWVPLLISFWGLTPSIPLREREGGVTPYPEIIVNHSDSQLASESPGFFFLF